MFVESFKDRISLSFSLMIFSFLYEFHGIGEASKTELRAYKIHGIPLPEFQRHMENIFS